MGNVGKGSCSVNIRYVCINMIKSIVSSCRERQVLREERLREREIIVLIVVLRLA